MTDNEYIIKVPKTPPKEELKNLQGYYILTEMRSPDEDVTIHLVREVFWSAKDGVFKHSGRIHMLWQLDIPYEDVKGCLSKDNVMFELEEKEIDTVEGEDDSLSEYQNGYNQGYIDALADISEVINKLKERKDYNG